jgi:hypothetical protein
MDRRSEGGTRPASTARVVCQHVARRGPRRVVGRRRPRQACSLGMRSASGGGAHWMASGHGCRGQPACGQEDAALGAHDVVARRRPCLKVLPAPCMS